MEPSSKHNFPLQFHLQDTTIVFRLLNPASKNAITNFACNLPAEDLLFLDRDITQQAVVDQWIQDVSMGNLTTILAWRDDTVVGYATFDRGNANWTRHVVELRVVVSESFRGIGLGRLLLEFVYEMALEAGATKLVARMTPDQTGARKVFQHLGFTEEAMLQDHAMDANGLTHDLLVLSFHIRQHPGRRCGSCGVSVLTALTLEGVQLCSHCYELQYSELGGGD
jgi:GNAT superfamily N-acetyltransferase